MTLVLSGTNGVSAVDGSAATPAIQGNDSNTGIFFPAADTVAIATGGIERTRIDASGRVTTPYQPAYLGINRSGSLNTGGTGTYVTWVHSTTKYNVGSHMNTSTGVFTCPIAGKYFVSTGFLTRGSGGGNTDHNVVVVLNGAQYGISARDIIVSGSGEGSTGCSGIVDAAANDAIRIDVANSSTGDFYFEWNYTSIYLIG